MVSRAGGRPGWSPFLMNGEAIVLLIDMTIHPTHSVPSFLSFNDFTLNPSLFRGKPADMHPHIIAVSIINFTVFIINFILIVM
jgi:hypothetical protein